MAGVRANRVEEFHACPIRKWWLFETTIAAVLVLCISILVWPTAVLGYSVEPPKNRIRG